MRLPRPSGAMTPCDVKIFNAFVLIQQGCENLIKWIFDETMKYVFLFGSVHRVMSAEKVLKENGISTDLIPVPREINSDCGVAVEVDAGIGEKALHVLEEGKISVLECYTKNALGKFEQRKQNL